MASREKSSCGTCTERTYLSSPSFCEAEVERVCCCSCSTRGCWRGAFVAACEHSYSNAFAYHFTTAYGTSPSRHQSPHSFQAHAISSSSSSSLSFRTAAVDRIVEPGGDEQPCSAPGTAGSCGATQRRECERTQCAESADRGEWAAPPSLSFTRSSEQQQWRRSKFIATATIQCCGSWYEFSRERLAS